MLALREAPRLILVCACLGPLAAAAQDEEDARPAAPRGESVEIEPYDGPPIYLPEVEPPPPPVRVESRVLREKFRGAETVQFERSVVRFSDDSIVSDGPHKEFYSNGQLHVEGEFALGVPTGVWTYYHENGQLAKKVSYKNGKPDGQVDVFSVEGTLIARRRYAEGKRDGIWELYTRDGEQLVRQQSYANGVADGPFKVWYSNGQLRQETNFSGGQRDGWAREWTRVGGPRAEAFFKDGKREGKATLWQQDGQVIEQVYEAGKLVSRTERDASEVSTPAAE